MATAGSRQVHPSDRDGRRQPRGTRVPRDKHDGSYSYYSTPEELRRRAEEVLTALRRAIHRPDTKEGAHRS
jgi:hypothetical protein